MSPALLDLVSTVVPYLLGTVHANLLLCERHLFFDRGLRGYCNGNLAGLELTCICAIVGGLHHDVAVTTPREI